MRQAIDLLGDLLLQTLDSREVDVTEVAQPNDAAADASQIAEVVANVEVSPVITAHPTEVQRQTIRRVLTDVAGLLDQRDRAAGDPSAVAGIDDRLRLDVLTLWQTALLRLSKLRVRDEIDEALRYYGSTLFTTVPTLTRDLGEMARSRTSGPTIDTKSAIAMGSWIGGDRDGNPFVTADVVRYATQRQAFVALERHLATLQRLAQDLSVSSRLVTPTAALSALAATSGDESPFRADEPYRRALRGMRSRLHGFAAEVLDADVLCDLRQLVDVDIDVFRSKVADFCVEHTLQPL